MNLTKRDLTLEVARQSSLHCYEVKQTIDTFLDVIKEYLCNDKHIAFNGFGSFTVKNYGAKTGYNYVTKERVPIPPHKVVKFKESFYEK